MLLNRAGSAVVCIVNVIDTANSYTYAYDVSNVIPGNEMFPTYCTHSNGIGDVEDGVSRHAKYFCRPDTVIGGTDGIDFPLHKIYNVADETPRVMSSVNKGGGCWAGV